MTRVGCLDCGTVTALAYRKLCECVPGELVPLHTAADVLAFKLRYSGREDEAKDVERRAAR